MLSTVANATQATALRFVDREGRLGRRMTMGADRENEVEIPRADLARVLAEAARDDAEFVLKSDDTEPLLEEMAAGDLDLVVGTYEQEWDSFVRQRWGGLTSGNDAAGAHVARSGAGTLADGSRGTFGQDGGEEFRRRKRLGEVCNTWIEYTVAAEHVRGITGDI